MQPIAKVRPYVADKSSPTRSSYSSSMNEKSYVDGNSFGLTRIPQIR